jgi:hypothetical protein
VGRTHDLLRQAEANIQQRSDQKKKLNDLELYLSRYGLGEDQIPNQNQHQIRQSLILLNRFIEKPDGLLNLGSSDCDRPETDFRTNIMPLLLERKKIALLRYDALINKEKFEKIRKLVKKIPDENIRTTIENSLCQLIIKDQIFKKEYLNLDKLRKPIK